MVYQEIKALLNNEPCPCAFVQLDAFDANATHLSHQVTFPNKTIRIATKSVRVPKLLKRALDSHENYKGLMCFDARELPVLKKHGFDDFMLAYPTLQKSDLKIIKEIHDSGSKLNVVVDSIQALEEIESIMKDSKNPLRVVIETDASLRLLDGKIHFGMRRSPLRSSEDLDDFLKQTKKFQKSKPIGLMSYEGQVAGLADQNPMKWFLIPILRFIRRESMQRLAHEREEQASVFKSHGYELEVFNGGGSGSINWTQDDPTITELTVGSGLMGSHIFDHYSNIRFQPAIFFALQTTRSSDDQMMTCAGGGYIASGASGADRLPIPYSPRGLKLLGMEGAGEVQTPVKGRALNEISLGDPVIFRPSKSGEIAERFKEYLIVQNSKIIDRYETYRGLGECFF